jgi:hypothetical protein
MLVRKRVADAFDHIGGVGKSIWGGNSGVDIDIDAGVHRHGVGEHLQLFTHQSSLFFGLLGECLVVKEPLKMVLSESLGGVEVRWRLFVELVIGID